MAWEHAGEARSALHAIVADPALGVAALSDPRMMSNLLTDLLAGAPREQAILVGAARAGVAGMLRAHLAAGMDGGTAVRLTSAALSAVAPFSREACDWVTAEFAVAMGVSVPGGGVTAAGPGWQPESDRAAAPARRRRGAVAVIVAAVIVAAGGGTAGVILAAGSGAGRSGTESFVATSSYLSGSPLAISLVGVFTASGTETITGRDRLLIRLPGGTFAGVVRPRKASSSVDGGTCVLTVTQPGTFTTGHGTGKYAGLAGSGTYHLVYTAAFRRASNGTCKTSRNSAPIPGSVTWVVHGTGPVTLP